MRLFLTGATRTLGTGALLAALAGPASAQQEPQVQPGWTFIPSFSLGGAWDDNVLLAGEQTASTLPDEYVTAITPAGALSYYTRRLLFSTAYQGSFSIYRELSELNSLTQNASASVQYRWTPRLTVSGGQSVVTARETDSLELIGVPFRRIGNRQFGTRGAFGLQLSRRTTIDGAYNFRVVDFDERDIDLTFPGGHEHLFSGGVQHQLSRRASIGASYTMRRMLVVDDPEAIVVHAAAGTGEYQFSETVTFSGSLGFSRVLALDSQDSRSGISGRASVSVRREHFTTNLYYERSMLPSFGFGGTYNNEQLAGTVQGAFARNRAYWQAGAAWRVNDPLIVDPLLPPDPSLRSTWIGSKLGYRASPWLSVEGYINHANQDAQRPGGKVDRTRVGFQVITSKPFRLAR